MNVLRSVAAALTKLLKGDERLAIYLMIGICGILVDFVLFNLLVKLGLFYHIANIISYPLGILTNLLLNLRYNFNRTEQVWQRGVSYVVIGLLGMVLSVFILFVIVETYAWSYASAKALTICFAALVQLWVNSNITLQKTFNLQPKD